MLPRRQAVAGAVLLGAGVLLGPGSAGGATPDVTASAVPLTISATTLDVGQLVYRGTVSVTTAAGPVATLELDITGADFHGLDLALPCVPIRLGGLTGRTATTGESTAAQLTVYATEVAAGYHGTPVRWSSTDPAYPPPPADSVLSGTLDQPIVVAVMATSSSLVTGGLTTTATFCSPSAGAALPQPAAPTQGPAAVQPGATAPADGHPGTSPGTGPSAPPSTEPSSGPSSGPSSEPSSEPSAQPSDQPTEQPSSEPTSPAAAPTGDPSPSPAP